ASLLVQSGNVLLAVSCQPRVLMGDRQDDRRLRDLEQGRGASQSLLAGLDDLRQRLANGVIDHERGPSLIVQDVGNVPATDLDVAAGMIRARVELDPDGDLRAELGGSP